MQLEVSKEVPIVKGTAANKGDKPFILNLSYNDIQKGYYSEESSEDVLIQICDPCLGFPTPKHPFHRTYQFEFCDIDENNSDKDMFDEFGMTVEQAEAIVMILRKCLIEGRNVVVHCVAGVCRSGAVVEVGTMMGFRDTGTHRIPNVWVKTLLMRSMGWTYDN